MPLNFFWETWSVFNSFFLIFPRKWYLVRNSRWEVYVCLSPLNPAASSFTAFTLLPSFNFGPPGQSFLSSCRFYAEHACRVYRLGVAYLHQLEILWDSRGVVFALEWTWAAAGGCRVFGHRRQTEGKLHWFSTLCSICGFFLPIVSVLCLFDIQVMEW